MNSRTPHSPHRQSGFSLIELMIAMLLGLFLIGAAIGVFVANKASSQVQEDLNNAQEAFRFASHTIKRVVQQGDSILLPGNGQQLRVLIDPAGEEGYKDCLGRVISVATTNTFFIVDGDLRCHVDTDNTTETLVSGLDMDRSEVLFGQAGDPYWRDNSRWRNVGGVSDWAEVRSVNVSLAMQDRRGDDLGRIGQFSATMRMPVLAETNVAGGGTSGGSTGGGSDDGAGDDDGDDGGSGGDDGSGDDGSGDDGSGDDGGDDGSGDDGDTGEPASGGDTPPALISCQCFFRNPGQGYSVVSHPSNDASCSAQCCASNDTGSGNNRSFTITVESC